MPPTDAALRAAREALLYTDAPCHAERRVAAALDAFAARAVEAEVAEQRRIMIDVVGTAVAEEREACAATDSLSVACRYCRATPGEMCWSDGRPLVGAHNIRTADAIRARKGAPDA
jgi:hypothetical protein